MAASKKDIEKRSARLLWPLVAMTVALLVTVVLGKAWNPKTTLSIAPPVSKTATSEPASKNAPAPAAVTRAAAVSGTGLETSRSQPGTNLAETNAQARAAELMQLAMNDDAASLETILKELRNPNRDIRAAALQAAIQFGSRDAIPGLNEAAQHTDDAGERTQLLAAVEFLKLPSLTELMQKERPPEASPPPVSSH